MWYFFDLCQKWFIDTIHRRRREEEEGKKRLYWKIENRRGWGIYTKTIFRSRTISRFRAGRALFYKCFYTDGDDVFSRYANERIAAVSKRNAHAWPAKWNEKIVRCIGGRTGNVRKLCNYYYYPVIIIIIIVLCPVYCSHGVSKWNARNKKNLLQVDQRASRLSYTNVLLILPARIIP